MAVLRRSSNLSDASSTLSSPPPSSDSELSELSASPSPPSSPAPFHRILAYASPSKSRPSSVNSSAKASPAPSRMRRTPPSDSDGPPSKRRKLDPKERTTERLDLTQEGVENDPQLKRVTDVLHKKRKIVVIAGAGISVSAGIPDFRSASGLFTSLRKDHKLKSSGKDLFDASVYQDDSSTSSFHDMVRSLSVQTKEAKPTPFHHLLATLAQEGRLLRLYSQNVDGIDTSLPPLKTEVPFPKKGPYPKTVQLHGGLNHMVCTKCHTVSDFDPNMFKGPVPPECPQCIETDQIRALIEKRSHGIGRLRPRMVLYNEHHPDDEAIGSCTSSDLRTRPDAIIVAGTTLKVPGVRRIVREMCAVVRDRRDGVTIWINNDPEPVGKDLENSWDIVVKGPCDEVARHAAMPKWNESNTWKEATNDEVEKAKERKAVVVVPQTPKKAIPAVQMPTPAASPRIAPLSLPQSRAGTPSKTGRKRKADTAEKKPKALAKTQTTAAAKRPAQRKTAARKAAAENQKVTSMFTVSKSTARSAVAGKKETEFINAGLKNEHVAKLPTIQAIPPASLPIDITSVLPRLEPSTPKTGRVTRLKPLRRTDVRVNRSQSPSSPTMEPFSSPAKSPVKEEYHTPNSSFSQSTYETPEERARPSTSDSHKSDMIVPDSAPRAMRNLIHMTAA